MRPADIISSAPPRGNRRAKCYACAHDKRRTTKTEIDKQFDKLKTLRDEIRVRLHLAGMEAKDTFAELEKQAEHLARDLKTASQHAVGEITTKLEALAASMTSDKPKA